MPILILCWKYLQQCGQMLLADISNEIATFYLLNLAKCKYLSFGNKSCVILTNIKLIQAMFDHHCFSTMQS